jgi:hypothetical protein
MDFWLKAGVLSKPAVHRATGLGWQIDGKDSSEKGESTVFVCG